MTVKRLSICVLALALMLTALLSGCEALQQFAVEKLIDATQAPEAQDIAALPTLPKKDAALIPLDVMMGYVEYTPPQISNDGSKILYRHMTAFKDNVMVEDWQTGKETIVSWPSEAMGNPYFSWAPDGETVFFFVDSMGDENYGLYTSNINTGETKTILTGGQNDCSFVAENPDNDKEVYLSVFNFNTELNDLFLLNYETGEMTLILENPGDITGFLFDYDGNLRTVTRADEQAGMHVWMKKDVNQTNTRFLESEWKNIFSWEYEDARTSGAYGFMQDGVRMLYMDSSETNTTSLYTYDTETGGTEMIFNDPDYEINGTWTDLELDEVAAVTVYSQKIEWHILDESFQDDYDVLASVDDGVFDIYGSSEEDEYWLVAYISDTEEMDYYVYDMQTQETTFLFNAREELKQYDFSPVEPFAYTSSDGLTIEGYATFPLGEAKENLPTVMLVHGGPWVRDTWKFDPEVQFLANRGYLVLQVNFRGSTGYGKDFILAGDKEWGRKMHQDILDAVDYAVQQGWTDEDRVGVYGASYGGYEALICAAFSSDVFQCAVDAFGPSSLLTFVESIPPQWSLAYQDLIRSVGDPETEADLMKERSPLYYAEDIRISLLIAQGENDVRVPQSESDQMVEALEAAGVPVTYMLFRNTGHGFNSNASRQSFYARMERFFAEHLGGRME